MRAARFRRSLIVLPAELLKLPDKLARVDGLLDDPVFFAPFVSFFDPRIGLLEHAPLPVKPLRVALDESTRTLLVSTKT